MTHQLVINGTTHTIELAPGEKLLFTLRERLGLTGTKAACERGECGTCTVLESGRPVMSCLCFTERCRDVETIEGLKDESERLRECFADAGAFQCGFCTPGQIVRCVALLRDGLPDDDVDLRIALSGNLCRCTGYQGIVAAVRRAAQGSTYRPSHGAA